MTRLQKIQIVTQQIAEAISSALSMDVTIADETLVRIAGTGCHQQTIGQSLNSNSIYSQVLRSGDEYLIEDISTSNACEKCGRKSICMELAQLCCPIRLGQDTIGVIGLIAFSQGQQKELVHKGRDLLAFMRKMAELVSAKVLEVEAMQRTMALKKQLQIVLNFVTEGIIAIDQQARICNLNFAAEKLLKVKASDVLGFHISEVFPGTPMEEALRDGSEFVDKEVKLWHRGHQHHYFISAKPIVESDIIQGVVASFRTVGLQIGRTHRIAPINFSDLIGNNHLFLRVLEEAKQAAAGSATILIGGESGTGKEVLAKAIHFASTRREGPFVAINCAAIPEALMESELFGYEEGAFTGAKRGGKSGKFQMANGGTLFLDEIGDMSLSMQVKVLRVIQDRIIEPVGGIQGNPIDVRILAASNRDLSERIKEGLFREDLYYRLNVINLVLPPLRQRGEDILLLARNFLQKLTISYDKNLKDFDSEALHCLQSHEWTGNVRELENAVECAVVKAKGPLVTLQDLPERLVGCMKDISERQRLVSLLAEFGSNVEGKKKAASALEISLATLYRKMKKYTLQ